MSDWSQSRSKRVTWDPEHARLKTASERLFSDSEVDDMVQDSERSLRSIRKSSETLRKELEALAKKREALNASHRREAAKAVPAQQTVKEAAVEDEEEETAPRRQKHAELTVEDYITSPDVLDFLTHFFPGKTEIAAEEFLECLDLDYPDLMQIPGFREELINRVTVNPEWISLNRLQTLTQGSGLEAALNELADGLEVEIQEEEKEVNAEIVSEMAELNRILAERTKELAAKEAELDKTAKDYQIMRNRILDIAQSEVERMAEAALETVKTQAGAQVKKLQKLEKTLMDHLRIVKAKVNSVERAKPEAEKTQAEIARLKARVQALEKTNDHLKGRSSALELELTAQKTQTQKISEDMGRTKARNSHLEQLVQDLKSQNHSLSELSQPKETPKPELPAAEPTQSPAAETALCLSVFSILTSALRDILPLFLAPCLRSSEEVSPVSSLRSSLAVGENWPGFGQILYPAFNALVPKLVELLPVATRNKAAQAAEQLVAVLHGLVTYTFTEHLRGNSSVQFPERIEFLPTTDFWKGKNSVGKTQDRSSPLYALFSNLRIQKSVVAQLKKLLIGLSPQCALQSAVLMLLLSSASKSQEEALRSVKNLLSETRTKQPACDFLLSDPSSSLLVIIETVKSSKESIAALACQVILLSSMHSSFPRCAQSISTSGCGFQSLADTLNNVLAEADNAEKTDLEEYLVVILQKLASGRLVTIRRKEQLAERISRRINGLQKSAGSADVNFVLENLASILQYAQ